MLVRLEVHGSLPPHYVAIPLLLNASSSMHDAVLLVLSWSDGGVDEPQEDGGAFVTFVTTALLFGPVPLARPYQLSGRYGCWDLGLLCCSRRQGMVDHTSRSPGGE